MFVTCPSCQLKVRRVQRNVPETIISKVSTAKYEQYVKEYVEDPYIDEDTGEIIKVMNYEEWKQKILEN